MGKAWSPGETQMFKGKGMVKERLKERTSLSRN